MHAVTLRDVREFCGYTPKEVAEYCGVSERQYNEYEDDCSEMPISIGRKIRKLYNIPLQFIHIGPSLIKI